MLYLETPAGVGFSYSMDPSYYDNVDDKMTGTSAFKHYCLNAYLLTQLDNNLYCFYLCSMKLATIWYSFRDGSRSSRNTKAMIYTLLERATQVY